MAPYVPPNRERFVIPKKIIASATEAEPLPPSIFPFERLPWDVLIYLLGNHVPLPDLVCLALASKRWLYLLTQIDSNIAPILHYRSAPASVDAVKSPFAKVTLKHDPSSSIIPILIRLQSHKLLPAQNIPCHGCCRVRRLGTESWWWDRCEEIYCEKTWRRRRSERKWEDRLLVDFEFAEFQSVFKYNWQNWRRHKPGQNTAYRFTENTEGGYEIEADLGAQKHKGQHSRSYSVDANKLSGTMARLNLEDLPKAICPECWATTEAKSISRRPPLRSEMF